MSRISWRRCVAHLLGDHRPAAGRIASGPGSRRVDVSVLGANVVIVDHASAAFLPDRWTRLRSCRAAFLPLMRVTSRRLSIAPAAVPVLGIR
ncbi:hypothetical protein ACIBCR_22495 [Micromonospora echinospora]|uniref:hypothetical protein n=1 Tax=Micromonospora echinospora TaxID=1877 RepID=UPI0037AE53FD